jgi:hypothetical protein
VLSKQLWVTKMSHSAALTGCDTVSSFFGKGKKSAWEAWNVYPGVTDTLISLSQSVQEIDQASLHVLERFVIIMYDRTSDCTDLDTARKHLFTKKSKLLESLPPTSSAFAEHVKRAIYQAVFCWCPCLDKTPKQQDPSLWGWVQIDNKWSPKWSTLSEVSASCQELIHCFCKKGCISRCKCVRANLVCTNLCQCDGECSRP